MLTLIDRWFEPVRVSQDYGRNHYLVLALILLVGVWLRFWGLGDVGLHGDEETMAMPAMAILETGRPILPSGMYYARAPVQQYLMAGSAWLFGESEWAFRFPSAVVGSLAGLAAFWMGRRFLSPAYNLAFVATITFLPYMIEVSQTARMYVFFVVSLMVYAALLFRWERDQRLTSLALTFGMWAVTLQFHALAAFAAPLFLFPGLSRRSWPQLIQGGAAFGLAGALWKLNKGWIGRHYPETVGESLPAAVTVTQRSLEHVFSDGIWLVLLPLTAFAIVTAWLVVRHLRTGAWAQGLPILLVGASLVAFSLLHYHVGGILLLFGVIGWLRDPTLSRRWLVALLIMAGGLCLVQLLWLNATGLYPGRKIIGALVGEPSIWPTLRFLEFSPIAALIYLAALAKAAVWLARGRRIPIHFLLFAMAVWAPLVVIGFFSWYVPPRYAVGQLPFFLFCMFAGLMFLSDRAREPAETRAGGRVEAVTLAAVVVLAVNPYGLAEVVPPGYDYYPDHKGAAEYIEGLRLGDEAVLVAEDVLQQTYYLGEVDYWLRETRSIYRFSVLRDGRLLDQYTSTPAIGTGEALRQVVEESRGKEVYVIGSGENFVGGSRLFRGDGIREVLNSPLFEPVFVGRDGKTVVWRAAPRTGGAR